MKKWLSLLFVPIVLSANNNLYFEHITQSDGLLSNNVMQIFQDSDGLMWFATYNGLASYNGYAFEEYKYSPDDSTTITHDFTLCITEESPRYLWIGTFTGFCRFDKEQHIFKRFNSPKWDNLANKSVRKIMFDNNDNIWIGSSLGLVIYNRKTDSVTIYSYDPNNPQLISDGGIIDLYFDSNNQVWIGTRTGLDVYNHNTKTFNHLLSDEEFVKIITYEEGIMAITRHFNRYYTPSATNVQFSKIPSLSKKPDFIFTDFLPNYMGAEWFAIREYGLFASYKEIGKVINYTHSKYNSTGINSNVPQCLYVDKNSNLWVGTFDGGVNFYSPQRKVFHNISDNFLKTGLLNNKVKTIYQDRDGDIWIGTKVGGMLSKFNIETQTFTHYRHDPNDPQSLSDEYIFAITDAEPGYLWVGTMRGGLNRFNKKTGKCERFLHDPSNEKSITSNNIKALYQDGDTLWISHHRHGIDKFDTRRKVKIKNYHSSNEEQGNIASNSTYIIFKDSFGKLWFATSYGLSRYNYNQNSFANYFYDEEDSTSLSDYMVLCIHEDNDKNLWVGTKNGLNRYNPNSDNFTVYNTKTGLPSNAIYGLSNDKTGALWISTNIGVCRFNWKEQKAKLYSVEDGIYSNEFTPSTYETSKDGYIFFGGNDGFTYFKPEEIKDNPLEPKILFTDFKLFNKSVKIGDESGVLKKHISKTDHIKLNHKQSVFSIEFTALNYISTSKNKYAYKMEGFDNDWQYVGTARTATYTNLNPGDYVFRVIASNNDEKWNNEGINLKITILPQWYQTLLFKIVAFLFILSLIIALYFLRINQLNKQKLKLEKEVKERTVEIEEKNKMLLAQTEELNDSNSKLEERQQLIEEQAEELKSQTEELYKTNKRLITLNATKDKFFSIIAHDLRNPFSALLGLSSVLLSKYDQYDDKRRKKLITGIDQSTKSIYRLLENLLQWSRSQTGGIKYSPEDFYISEVVENAEALLQNSLHKKGLSFSKKIPDKYKIYADRNMISTVIRNLISNAIKYSEKGEIKLEVEDEPELTIVKIIDEGIGMDEKIKNQVFEVVTSKSVPGTQGELGTGLGLIICKEFIEKHNGSIGVESSSTKGSVFLFSLPKNNKPANN